MNISFPELLEPEVRDGHAVAQELVSNLETGRKAVCKLLAPGFDTVDSGEDGPRVEQSFPASELDEKAGKAVG